jgi:fluoride exporter
VSGPSTAAAPRLAPAEIAGVCLGGAAGATARYGALETWPVQPGTFPTTVLLVNLVASAVLGFLLARLDPRHGPTPSRVVPRAVLVAGLVGGFGTISTVAVEIALLVADGQVGTAATYGAATLVGGLVVLYGGLLLGGWRPAWHTMPEEDEL